MDEVLARGPVLSQNTTDASQIIEGLGKQARAASFVLNGVDGARIDRALDYLAAAITSEAAAILAANAEDLSAIQGKDLGQALVDRLTLTSDRVAAMATAVKEIRNLPDPCGKILEERIRPNGLIIQKISVPIGVLGMIYESRPNVTIDAAALCLKSRNAVILRPGSESFHTSHTLHRLVTQSLEKAGLPPACVGMTPNTDRALVGAILEAVNYIDVIIPRGGKGLTSRVMSEAKMPVFAHLDGNCHIYVHDSARRDLILPVIKNAKLRRTGVCGAVESLLLDKKLPAETTKPIIEMLLSEGCVIVGDKKAQSLSPAIAAATEDDWRTEYLDKKISIKFVSGVDEAVSHINLYGSHHTDSILAEDKAAVQAFTQGVDSAIVMHNAPTQFADGGEFGMGGEIGIGTGKLHARGPVGVEQLTTFKYIVRGDGQTRP